MKHKPWSAILISVILIVLIAPSCPANSIMQLDTEGNLSMSSEEGPGDSSDDSSSGSSEGEFEESADLDSSGFSGGDSSISGGEETIQYTTEFGYLYSLVESNNPFPTNRLCMLLIPADMDQEEFMDLTEWGFFSVINGFDIVLLSCDWDDEEAAAEYFESVYDEVLEQKEEEAQEEPEIFLVGYEEGADFAALEAASHTLRYSGLVMLGGKGISEERLDEFEKDGEREALSVWIITSQKTSEITANLRFWRTVDSITGTNQRAYQLRFADELYLPPTSTLGKIASGSNRMGIVLYSRKEDYYDFAVSENIARNFIGQVESGHVSFRDGITGGEIISINDRHFSYNRLQMDGQQRDYWIYVPDAAFLSMEPSTLILCLHGNGCTGEDMIFQTQWQKVASEHNCIVVYPSSLYTSGFHHDWIYSPEERNFCRYLVETVCSRYQIDCSRIYLNGFSKGAGMCQDLCIRCPDLFAASVMTSPAYWEKECYGPVDEIHEVATLFTYGTSDQFLFEYDMTAEIDGDPATRKLQYWEQLYGFDHDSYEVHQKGIYTAYTYRSPNQIPICHWVKVEGTKHVFPTENLSAYYEFLHHFTKDPDGNLYFDGEQVTSRHTQGETWDEYQGIQY